MNLSSNFRMIDVSPKEPTQRVAVAEGHFYAKAETIKRIKEKSLPKGDVLALAEVAGITGAKQTSFILPLCHPLALDAVRISCEVEENKSKPGVRVLCEVSCYGKTGVEMEALSGVNAALLCLYDLTKNIDPVLEIGDIFLRTKTGGKTGNWLNPRLESQNAKAEIGHDKTAIKSLDKVVSTGYEGLRFAVLTTSDRASRGETEDVSGVVIKDMLTTWGASFAEKAVVPDDIEKIKTQIDYNVKELRVPLVIITGGTGAGPRDVTPEALNSLQARLLSGIGELMRKEGSAITNKAWLSRAGAYVYEGSLILSLPGSPKAVKENLEIVQNLIPHLLKMIKGEGH
jgi:molybdenum cofactor biosynthesis protein MoaC